MKLIILLFGILTIQVSAFAQRPPDGENIQYGSDPDETLDYWVGASVNSPILFLIHGGGWRSGDKRSTNWRNAAQLFYDKGYAVVNINYILSVNTNYTGFPMQSQNVACALAWTKTNHTIINGDTSKIVLFGNSAGAHLATLHSLNHPDSLLQGCSSYSSLDVLGVISLSGIFDFDLAPQNNQNSIQAIRDMVVDSINYWKHAQPIENVSQNTKSKFLILHGTTDNTVGDLQPFSFSDSLISKGYCTRMNILQSRQHDLLKFIDSPSDPVRLRVNNYLDSLFSEQICSTVLSINEEGRLPKNISIFPNPTTDIVRVNFKDAFNGTLRIWNLNGIEILSKGLKNTHFNSIDFTPFSKGIYFLETESFFGEVLIKKIIYK